MRRAPSLYFNEASSILPTNDFFANNQFTRLYYNIIRAGRRRVGESAGGWGAYGHWVGRWVGGRPPVWKHQARKAPLLLLMYVLNNVFTHVEIYFDKLSTSELHM